MVSAIDPAKAPIGTVGFLAADADIDVRNADDLAYLKEPSVILGEDRQWRWLPEFRSLGNRVVSSKIYDNWLDALEAGIVMERRDITEDREAVNAKLIEMDHREARLDTVTDYLNSERAKNETTNID